MSNWKNFERRVASIFGGKRIPVNGRAELDIEHNVYGIECKYRKSLPAWLFEKAGSQANEGDGIPTVVVGKHSSAQMFAITDLEYFVHIAELAQKYARDYDESD